MDNEKKKPPKRSLKKRASQIRLQGAVRSSQSIEPKRDEIPTQDIATIKKRASELKLAAKSGAKIEQPVSVEPRK